MRRLSSVVVVSALASSWFVCCCVVARCRLVGRVWLLRQVVVVVAVDSVELRRLTPARDTLNAKHAK